MDKIVYVCTGNCLTDVTKEEYESGKTVCQEKDCSKFGAHFEKLDMCCGGGCCQQEVQG